MYKKIPTIKRQTQQENEQKRVITQRKPQEKILPINQNAKRKLRRYYHAIKTGTIQELIITNSSMMKEGTAILLTALWRINCQNCFCGNGLAIPSAEFLTWIST